jgi:hypothetical protein
MFSVAITTYNLLQNEDEYEYEDRTEFSPNNERICNWHIKVKSKLQQPTHMWSRPSVRFQYG